MAYVDLATIQTIAAGQPLAAATVQQIRDNGEFLIDPPACSVFNSAAQSVPDNTLTALTANSENFDNDSMHSTASNTSRITIQTPGRYLLTAVFEFAANTAGHRQWEFRVNGTTSYGMMRVDAVTTGAGTYLSGSRTLTFAAGNYVEVRVLHLAGGALNVTLHEFAAMFRTR